MYLTSSSYVCSGREHVLVIRVKTHKMTYLKVSCSIVVACEHDHVAIP